MLVRDIYVALLNRLYRISNSITYIIICGSEEESIIDSGRGGGVDWLAIASASTIAGTGTSTSTIASTVAGTVASTIAITESIVGSVDLVAVLLVLIFRVILASYTSAEDSRIKSFKKT
ncbi:uncharacterized protein RAG0_13218 [Rhynchosporium agropyri]|uniref:Uncharacterized protein n=1 Tax=Rhynchosporium agropyri TaxID=914238 RepID=A0A1E1LBW5_9HELO|nr:uncharacterized protein RAG0_13218 [Rhynchosporium agropyri]